MRSHVSFEIRVDFEFGSAYVTLERRVPCMSPKMNDQLTRVSRRVGTNHALERSIIRVSPHVLLHGAALAARVVAELTAKWFEAGMNALVNLEFVDAIEGLFALATYERLFTRVDEKMPLQVLGVFCDVVATWMST